MIHGVSAPGLSVRPYFNRYTEDAIDLCDALSSFSPQGKATLHEISRVMGLPGKPKGIDGGEVERYFHEGKIKEIADYCETDVVNTYRVWLRYELFRGTLSQNAFEASERNLGGFHECAFKDQRSGRKLLSLGRLNDPNDHRRSSIPEFMSQRNSGKPRESRRGRPLIGRDPVVAVRLPHEAIADVDRLARSARTVVTIGCDPLHDYTFNCVHRTP